MTWQTNSNSSNATEKLGELLAHQFKGGEVIELSADLGGGKTTFVRGLARGLDSKDAVSSPTFTLNQIYRCKDGLELHHYDFYRLQKPGVMAEELAESLHDNQVITVVEWSDIVSDVLPEERLSIKLEFTKDSENVRNIIFNYPKEFEVAMKKLSEIWSKQVG